MGSIRAYKSKFVEEISSYYDEREASTIFFMAFEELSEYSKAQFLANQDEEIKPRLAEQLDSIKRRLLEKEPIQYILKKAFFKGESYLVNPSVLLPRPETEELVDWVLSSCEEEELSLLDIGTGSGCIAIALKKERKAWDIHAWDISEEALEIASKNASLHNVDLNFKQQDVCLAKEGNWNVIISNPPYVPLSERSELKPHVINHEPEIALFSKTEDPLYFYKYIVNYAENSLNPAGFLFLEGHMDYMEDLAKLFSDEAWSKVDIKDDFQGKPRMLRAQLNE